MNFRRGESAEDVINRLGAQHRQPIVRRLPTPLDPAIKAYIERRWREGAYYANIDIDKARTEARIWREEREALLYPPINNIR